MNTMKYLIEKYPTGYEGWEEDYNISQEDEITGAVIGLGNVEGSLKPGIEAYQLHRSYSHN